MPLVPRIVVITRKTVLDGLLERHGTRSAAAFFLKERGQDLQRVEQHHAEQVAALQTVLGSIPRTWRRARIDRSDLDRFLFEPEDLLVAVGQDGLVANVAKYLKDQPVIGINPAPDRQPGVLVQHSAEAGVQRMLALGNTGRAQIERRVMVEASLDDGQSLRALNEIFIGHRSHQSARYQIAIEEVSEHHSSSGVLVCTGTGSTGWASSLLRQRRCELVLPQPEDPTLAFFVREAWPSPATGCAITEGLFTHELRLTSAMTDNGVIFGDGIEEDALTFRWGQTVTLRPSAQRLALVT